jgi:DNA-binding MarR family transcriptional regulator
MSDEINFFDLAALFKIKPDTTMEKFGGMLNSSYFDGANIAATLSQKKLINFNTSLPGQSIITLTEEGKQFIDEANSKAQAEFDHLDFAILVQIANNKKTPSEIGSAVNVRPKDLAIHLYKLAQQDFVSYEFRSGNIFIMLTEKGFSQVKTGMPKKNNLIQNAQNQNSINSTQTEEPKENEQRDQEVVAQWQSTNQINQNLDQNIKKDVMQDQALDVDPSNQSKIPVEEVEKKIKNSKQIRKIKTALIILVIIILIVIVLKLYL